MSSKKSADIEDIESEDIEFEIEGGEDIELSDEILIEDTDEDVFISDTDEKKEPEINLSDISIYGENVVLSKHQQNGKHSLKHDSLFKGKIEDADDLSEDIDYYADKFDVDRTSNSHYESIENEEYLRSKMVKEKVYEALLGNTDLNFMNNRRKPSKTDFNKYFWVVKQHVRKFSFSNVEIFNELSVYFSDNLFNMFKLLDNKWRNLIIQELQIHIGKRNLDYQISKRNLINGTEIEFQKVTSDGLKRIGGVITQMDIDDDGNIFYIVDSYENLHNVQFLDILRIVNHTQFKYNLNKLNNIDFL
jgi:hypothetical protein